MNRLIEKLRDAPPGLDDYSEYLEEALDGNGDPGDLEVVFKEAFQFFERHSDADLGMPGPLVHFLEDFYPDYLDALSESVERKPTMYTVWMVNRVLNDDIPDEVRTRMLALLRCAAANPAADEESRESAVEFLDEQGEPP